MAIIPVEAGFVLKTSPHDLEQQILKGIAAEINRALTASIYPIKMRVGPLVMDAIEATPEYQSLLNGTLRVQLGLSTAENALIAIKQTVANNMEVTVSPASVVAGAISGGLDISILRSDYEDVFALQGSGGSPIKWLEWLLTAGDSIVVAEYDVYYTSLDPDSRTGEAIMIKGEGYRIPPEFSGTQDNNWLIRAIFPLQDNILGIVTEEVMRRF